MNARSCKNCIWSSVYMRGLLCHYIEKMGAPRVPAYLQIVGNPYLGSGLNDCYPYQLDTQDLAENCFMFELPVIEK